jgi:hypothetical protein
VELGLWPGVAGAELLAGAILVLRAWRRDRVRAITWTLGVTSIVFCATLLLFLFPRYDRHFNQPLRELARRAAQLVPEGDRVVVHGLRRRPSVLYYGGRETEENRYGLCGPPPPPTDRVRVGISTMYFLKKARVLDRVEVLAENLGYVLFRTVPGSAPAPDQQEGGDPQK